MEFSSRHTEMIVINGGVSFRVMVKVVLNLVTFCRRLIEVFHKFHKHLTRLVMTLHAVVEGVSKKGQKETKRAKLLGIIYEVPTNYYYITAD